MFHTLTFFPRKGRIEKSPKLFLWVTNKIRILNILDFSNFESFKFNMNTIFIIFFVLLEEHVL